MGFWEIALAELPNVNNVPIEDKVLRLYTVQISDELFGMATIGPEMDIGNNGNFNFSL